MHLSRRDCLGLLGAGAALAASASGEEISREERMKWWHEAQIRHVHPLGTVQRARPARMGDGRGRHSRRGIPATGASASRRNPTRHGLGHGWPNRPARNTW